MKNQNMRSNKYESVNGWKWSDLIQILDYCLVIDTSGRKPCELLNRTCRCKWALLLGGT